MMKRLAKSRGMRKFRQNRLAMVALAIIVLYFICALLVMVGFVNLEDTRMRVGSERRPGFLEPVSREKRFDHLKWHVEELQRVIGRAAAADENARLVLDEMSWAERSIVDLPLEELQTMLADAMAAYLTLDDLLADEEDALDEFYAIEDTIAELEADGEPIDSSLKEDLEHFRQDLEVLRPRIEEAMDKLDARIKAIHPIPDGWRGFKYGLRTFLGTDSQGASISTKSFYSIKIAFQVGMVTSIVAVIIGTLLGAAAGFFAGWVDHAVMWIVSTLSSIPYLVLLAVFVYMFTGTIFTQEDRPGLALVPLYCAFGLTFWIGTCRVIRGEVMKIKELEYVQAATAIGFGRFYIVLKHVIPNTAHLMFINFSLLFIGAIKSEVILTFLGLGVKGQPSWGIMISHGADGVLQFFFWEVGVATAFMFGLVLAFNILSDALQDAFDPKHVS